jgi:hypothetical protein
MMGVWNIVVIVMMAVATRIPITVGVIIGIVVGPVEPVPIKWVIIAPIPSPPIIRIAVIGIAIVDIIAIIIELIVTVKIIVPLIVIASIAPIQVVSPNDWLFFVRFTQFGVLRFCLLACAGFAFVHLAGFGLGFHVLATFIGSACKRAANFHPGGLGHGWWISNLGITP